MEMGSLSSSKNKDGNLMRDLKRMIWACSLLALCGCGGGSSGPASRTGAAVFVIKWPDRPTRLIPIASNSIRIVFRDASNNVAADQTITRPNDTATFSGLLAGDYTVTATAYPNNNATGVAQATGAIPFRIDTGQTNQATLTMNS